MNRELAAFLAKSHIQVSAPKPGVIDCAAWIGQYPFRGILRSSLADWKDRARELRISRAIVSPFESIFWENNLDAYLRCADELAGEKRLDVWPVVRPGGTHEIERILNRLRPRGIRLLPCYHDYHLYDSSVEPIMRIARERGMIVQVFTRIADERWHWILKTPELPLHDIEYAVSVYHDQPILVSGLNSPQALAVHFKQHPQLFADVSRVRGPAFAMEKLLTADYAHRLVFGSLWPIQIIEATLWQATSARTPAKTRNALLHGSAHKLLH